MKFNHENYVTFLIGQAGKIDAPSLPEQTLKEKCVVDITLDYKIRGRAEWAQKFR
jgi:hypothetical protein